MLGLRSFYIILVISVCTILCQNVTSNLKNEGPSDFNNNKTIIEKVKVTKLQKNNTTNAFDKENKFEAKVANLSPHYEKKGSIQTEGGLIPIIVPISEPDGKSNTSLSPLEPSEMASSIVTSSIVARKGVNNDADSLTPTRKNVPNVNIDISTANATNITKQVEKQLNVTSSLQSPSPTTPSTTTEKVIPKKPLITKGSDESLPLSDISEVAPKSYSTETKVKEISTKIPKSSPPSVAPPVSPVIEEPVNSIVEEKAQYLKGYFDPVSRGQPGFIIPLVISLFAVPLLIMAGYVAVRRGKEAWRNRHYRRMDFLIDGMYND